jgi:integrase
VARGSIVRRGDAFRIAVELPPNAVTGKRRQRWETFHGTKREAEKRLTELLSLADQRRLGINPRTTLREFLTSWLENEASQRAPKTYARYKQLVENQVAPALGNVRLGQLGASQIVGLDKTLRDRHYAAQTRKHVFRLLHVALAYAVALRVLSAHPMDGLKAPSVPKSEMRTFTVAQAKAFLDATTAEGPKWHAFFLIAITTGLRQSELRGLRWQDVDLDHGMLRVQQSIMRVHGIGRVTKGAKNDGSRRAVALDQVAREALVAHRAAQRPLYRLGPIWQELDLVFPSEVGTPLEDKRIHRVFTRACAAAEVPRIRPYDLRHSCASFLLAAGVHPKVVAERLGHSSVNLTLNTYSHLLPGLQQEAADTLGKLLR